MSTTRQSRATSPVVLILLTALAVLVGGVGGGCAANPTDRWHQSRDALTQANEGFLAVEPHLADEEIVLYGGMLQTARGILDHAHDELPDGGPDFNRLLDVVEAILLQLSETEASDDLRPSPGTGEADSPDARVPDDAGGSRPPVGQTHRRAA